MSGARKARETCFGLGGGGNLVYDGGEGFEEADFRETIGGEREGLLFVVDSAPSVVEGFVVCPFLVEDFGTFGNILDAVTVGGTEVVGENSKDGFELLLALEILVGFLLVKFFDVFACGFGKSVFVFVGHGRDKKW